VRRLTSRRLAQFALPSLMRGLLSSRAVRRTVPTGRVAKVQMAASASRGM